MSERIIGPDPSSALTNSDEILLHASCVAGEVGALLIIGASGSGKSSLALQLLALGARLVADDQTRLTRQDTALIARAPATIAGQIEARGIGILAVEACAQAPVIAVIDMEKSEKDRLPQTRSCRILDIRLPLIYQGTPQYFAAGLRQYLKGGRRV